MASVVTINTKLAFDDDKSFALMSRGGDYIWLSGQTAHDGAGRLMGEGDIIMQARYAFQNIKDILSEHAGCGMEAIVRLTTYFVEPLNENLARRYWEVRREFFGANPPASTGIQVVGLVTPETLIEIDAVAFAPLSDDERTF